MGKAARWLKGLLSGGGAVKKKADPKPVEKEKKGWSFARSFRDKEQKEVRSFRGSGVVDASSTPSRVAVLVRDEDEQSKRAIAVAAATAVAAEAAVAAAHAAAAVVRLTSKGSFLSVASGRACEDWAAVKIQAVFRGYLARRALRALKGLVKLQALVRGHIVRKQAVETLRCMQALVRAQSRVCAGRALDSHSPIKGLRHNHTVPPASEKYEPSIHVTGAKPVRPGTVGRNASKAKDLDTSDPNLLQSSSWNWLDRWMEERYWDSREALSRSGTATDDEKILEIDAGKPHLSSKWRNNHHSMSSSVAYDQNIRSYGNRLESPSKDSTIAQHSVPSPSSVGMQQSASPLSFPCESEDLFESPQFFSASSRTGSSRRGPFTPSKSECSHSVLSGYSDYPNYMSNTESFKAKVRSHSAPRQRPELEKTGCVKRSSACGYGASDLWSASQRTSSLHLKFTGKAYPGSGRLDSLGMPIRTL